MIIPPPQPAIPPAYVSDSVSAEVVNAYGGFIAEASQKFGIPEAWIRAVINIESRYKTDARSPKGALGLMQLMPPTWQKMRTTYNLGNDPLDPRDNILAGTAYLRELYDNYGGAGFLAAYNAGPGRYEGWLNSAKPLPAETLSYVASLSKLLALDGSSKKDIPAIRRPIPWTQSAIFAGTSVDAGSVGPTAAGSSNSPFVAQTKIDP